MHATDDAPPPEQSLCGSPGWSGDPQIVAHESRNLALLAIHQIILRVGWIFKTESVIMPAFLDFLAGPHAGLLRGFMPLLNRFGQSLPPVFLAEWLQTRHLKRRALASFTCLMSLVFCVLSLLCLVTNGNRFPWMPLAFLGLYGVFFVAYGLYQVSFGMVQGKLIRPTRRGFLLLQSTFWGALPAMFFAWFFLSDWLKRPDGGFGLIFCATAVCFFLAALVTFRLAEPRADGDHHSEPRQRGNLADTLHTLRQDANLRRLVVVAMLFGSSLIIFPHYQAYAREELQLRGLHLMVWVIAQNASVGLLSLVVGPLADALGNRVTLRAVILGSALAPLYAVSLGHISHGMAARLFWILFVTLGITPLVLRILVNYTLEICEPADHARYLSTMSLCVAVPFLFAPLVGWLVDTIGFEMVFLASAGLIVLGGLMTFGLDEPRHRVRQPEIGPLGTAGENG